MQEEARQGEEPELRLRALGIGQGVVVSALEHVDHGVSETPALAFGEVVAFVAEGGHRGDDELHDVNVVDGRPARGAWPPSDRPPQSALVEEASRPA